MVQLVLQRRDYLKASTALGGVPGLLSKIREVLLSTFSLLSCHASVHVPGSKGNNRSVNLSSPVSRLLYGNEVGIHQLE